MKYEFASREWFAALHAIFSERAAIAGKADPDLRVATCEVFLNPPKHLLAPGQTKLAWHCKVRGADVHFALSEVEASEVDTKIEADYTTILPFARIVVDGDKAVEADMEAKLAQVVAAGKVKVIKRSTAPSALGSIHDAICRLTA